MFLVISTIAVYSFESFIDANCRKEEYEICLKSKILIEHSVAMILKVGY